jgi:hypothetical protein
MSNELMMIAAKVFFFAFLYFMQDPSCRDSLFIPVNVSDRHSIEDVRLTAIGKFGLLRKARPTVPSHFHAGADIQRPNVNYLNEPIYPIAKGMVISRKTNGPYAQLIIEHKIGSRKIWSLYEHIAGIMVSVNDSVYPSSAIARFMNREELNKYGWKFDHVHLEILKIQPLPLHPDKQNPDRYYYSYSLVCYNKNNLDKYFFDPIFFFNEFWREQ